MAEDNVTQLPPPKKRPAGPGRGHKVKQGSGIPAAGPGWGGAAKGASASSGTVGEHPERFSKLEPDERIAKIENKAAAADRALGVLYEVMERSEYDASKIAAANSLLDRIEGKAVQRSIGGTTDTVEEIRTRDPIQASREYKKMITGK